MYIKRAKIEYSAVLCSFFFYKSFFWSGGTLTRIEAKVADEYEAGTDCIVHLKLKNWGTAETCKTGALDDRGNSWARGDTEVYDGSSVYKYCRNFQPRENLQFKLILDPLGCVDHIQLFWVRVYFRRTYFQWSGQHWFTPTSDWMNFDFKGIAERQLWAVF